MGKVLGPDGVAFGPEKFPIDWKAAELTHKVIMVYLRHQFGDAVEMCDCAGCTDVRELLGGKPKEL